MPHHLNFIFLSGTELVSQQQCLPYFSLTSVLKAEILLIMNKKLNINITKSYCNMHQIISLKANVLFCIGLPIINNIIALTGVHNFLML